MNFRRSRTALLLDLLIFPILFVLAILRVGISETIRQFYQYPRIFLKNWRKNKNWV